MRNGEKHFNDTVDSNRIHTHEFPLAQAEEALETAKQPDKTIKVVITND